MFCKRKRGTQKTQNIRRHKGREEKRKTGDMRDTTDRRGHRELKGHKQHRGLKGTLGTQVRQKSEGTQRKQGTQGTQGDKEVTRGLYLNFLRYRAPMETSLRAEWATLCK